MEPTPTSRLAQWKYLAGFAGALVAAAVAAIPVLNWLAEHVPGIVSWIGFNLRVIANIEFVRHGVYATAFGTAVCLAVPWIMPPERASHRTQSYTRFFGALSSFTVALAQDPSRAGLVFAGFCFFSGPMCGMFVVRFVTRCALRRHWIPLPDSLRPTKAEARAITAAAIGAEKPHPTEKP